MESPSQSSAHLRNLKIAIEFKYLMKHAPGGVFIMPEFDSIRTFHGVIFVRRGIYRDGIFRFTLKLPEEYSSHGTHPQITFHSTVYNPLVNPDTGFVDISVDPGMHKWEPERHFIVNALAFLKGIFYVQSFDSFKTIANQEALNLYQDDIEAYKTKAKECVQESLTNVYDPVPDSCSIIFSEPKAAHDVIKQNVIGQLNQYQQVEEINKEKEGQEEDTEGKKEEIEDMNKLTANAANINLDLKAAADDSFVSADGEVEVEVEGEV